MIIRLTAHVGVFTAQADCESLDEANSFIEWVYKTEDGEERQAIKTESKALIKNVDPPLEVTPTVTVADAVQAVKNYAAVHKPDKARELMQKFGISRTSEITAEIAPQILEATRAS